VRLSIVAACWVMSDSRVAFCPWSSVSAAGMVGLGLTTWQAARIRLTIIRQEKTAYLFMMDLF